MFFSHYGFFFFTYFLTLFFMYCTYVVVFSANWTCRVSSPCCRPAQLADLSSQRCWYVDRCLHSAAPNLCLYLLVHDTLDTLNYISNVILNYNFCIYELFSHFSVFLMINEFLDLDYDAGCLKYILCILYMKHLPIIKCTSFLYRLTVIYQQ